MITPISQIEALLKSECINFFDKELALKSLSETCMPKRLSEIYLKELTIRSVNK